MENVKNDNITKIIDKTDNILGCKKLKETLELYSDYIDLKKEDKINVGNYNCIVECRSNGNQYKQVIDIINELLIEKNIVDGKYINLKNNLLEDEIKNKLCIIDDEKKNIYRNEIRDMIQNNPQNVFIILVNRGYEVENAKIFFKENVYWSFTIDRISEEEKQEYIKNKILKNNFLVKENSTFIQKLSSNKIFDIDEILMKSFVKASKNNVNILDDDYFEIKHDSEPVEENINRGIEKLDILVGLYNVKRQIHQIIDYVEVHKKRGSMPMLHMVFRGNPRNRENRSCKDNRRNIF